MLNFPLTMHRFYDFSGFISVDILVMLDFNLRAQTLILFKVMRMKNFGNTWGNIKVAVSFKKRLC